MYLLLVAMLHLHREVSTARRLKSELTWSTLQVKITELINSHFSWPLYDENLKITQVYLNTDILEKQVYQKWKTWQLELYIQFLLLQ